MPAWRELGEYINPRRPRFTSTDVNRGDRRNQKIIDSTATLASRTLRAGMMSGITSPARPWFKLTLPDIELNELEAVKEWLSIVGDRLNSVFLKSNLYNVLPIMYGDLGTFGTAAIFVEEDLDSVLHFYPLPIGSYMLSQNEKLKVDVLMREFQMTVRQIVQKFGIFKNNKVQNWDAFSVHVRNMWISGQKETNVDVCHAVMPNPDADPKMLGSEFKKFLSVYYETGAAGQQKSYFTTGVDDNRYLRKAGYDYFPVLAARWETTGEDVYATDCPGMTTIGDIKQLQIGERRVAQAIDKMINPPMVGNPALRTAKASILPGDTTYVDTSNGSVGFKPAHEVRFDIGAMEGKQGQVRNRVQRGWFEDIFLMITDSDRRTVTATEIAEKKQEKLLVLGPVLEQLNTDVLDNLIDLGFYFMDLQGLLPPPPQQIQGQRLKVEYISIMAQAQKLLGINSVDRFVGFIGQMAQYEPKALMKLNVNKTIDRYADMLSIDPSILNTDEEVAKMAAAQAAAQQQQQQAEQITQLSGAAKNLAQAPMDSDSALSRIVDSAQAGQQAEA